MKARCAILVVCAGMVGCFLPRTRLQSPDEPEHRPHDVRTLGDITTVATQEEFQVVGVGLVTQLNGTGGGAPPASQFRDTLENDLKKKGVRNPKAVMESPDCAMVLVSARIPAGARKNDLVDIEITLPEMSRCTSLRGGYLTACELFTFDSARRLSPNTRNPDQYYKGYALLKAEGAVITGVGGAPTVKARGAASDRLDAKSGDDTHKLGSVWGGGKVQFDPPLVLVLNSDQQYSRVAAQVADRINQTFPGMKYGRDGLASAKNKSNVVIGVPLQYRHNLAHYLRVLRAIPLDRAPGPDSPYRKTLSDQLLDGSQCLSAAIRLEALGEDSVPALRSALSAPLPLSRFAAAQALTYLRKRDGVDELARLAREQPVLRGLALTALASLDESICHVKLADLMAAPEPDIRYGAFRALRVLDERSPEVAAEQCGSAYFLHRVAVDSQPMVHYLTGRRTEFVLFGQSPSFLPDMRLGFSDEFTIVAEASANTCKLKRFSTKEKRVVERTSSLAVADVLKTLTELGGTYSDAVDLLRKADASGRMNCSVQCEAIPPMVDPSQLARAAKEDPTLRTMPASVSSKASIRDR